MCAMKTAPTKLVLVQDPRRAASAPVARRYRLARIGAGNPGEGPAKAGPYEHLARVYD